MRSTTLLVPAAALAVVLVLLLSCTGSPPEILYPDTQLLLLHDPHADTIAEVLRLFVAVRDPDGADDPARIFLVHPDQELYWEFSREEWAYLEHGGEHWYGMPDIRMPDGRSLPRGRYRVIVEDAGLARSETDLFLSAEVPDRDLPAPRLVVDGGDVRVSYSTEVVLRVYTRSGQLVLNQIVAPGALPEGLLRQIPDEAGVQAFVSTLQEEVRRVSGPYALPQ